MADLIRPTCRTIELHRRKTSPRPLITLSNRQFRRRFLQVLHLPQIPRLSYKRTSRLLPLALLLPLLPSHQISDLHLRSVSSPVRPPRRQPSNLSLIPKSDQSQSSDSTAPSSVFAPPVPSSSSSTLEDPASLSPTKSRKTNVSPVLNGGGSPRSPRPPSIPEKSRRRASTLGLGLKKGHGRSESVEIDGTSSENGHGMEGTGGGSFTK